ncbi:glycosyltransferase [Pedobacter agri]|uniref:glycosyltransferase n=1 Tax=Pedobacter agri TaxID=454586 RepID=UPI00292E9D66|nr:glycosyltransferase [Pedobacter agri]
MKILLVMDPGISIPPPLYGGHERLVAMFANEYYKLGHQVSLLAGPNSNITGEVNYFGSNNLNRGKWHKFIELLYAWYFLFRNRKNFDIIHNFGRLAYLIPILNTKAAKLMTYGRAINPKGIKIISALPNKNLTYTACSNYCVSTGNVIGTWKTVYNAIDFSKYKLNLNVLDDAPLIFLGRLDKIKGVHTAIKVAKKTNKKLLIGGNISHTPDNLAYFNELLKPQFDDKQIIYLGALNDEDKNKYLRLAKALLFPIEWDEPFGMVMVEAMACGTPVIAFNKGAVPEIVVNDLNGYRCDSIEQMIEYVSKIDKIDRTQVRNYAETRFSSKLIAQQYLELK